MKNSITVSRESCADWLISRANHIEYLSHHSNHQEGRTPNSKRIEKRVFYPTHESKHEQNITQIQFTRKNQHQSLAIMPRTTRSLANPPAHYYQLTTKQQQNWRRATRKIEKNEQMRSDYPPFQSITNVVIIHVHRQTTLTTMNRLIQKVKGTTVFSLDTESEVRCGEEQGALIQIECIHSLQQSTVIVMETGYLPEVQSTLYLKIVELWSIIMSSGVSRKCSVTGHRPTLFRSNFRL
jgi:hypothetical protein